MTHATSAPVHRVPIDRWPVVIVGAGPTGTTAAITLGRAGVASLVLDRWDDVYPQPRAVHLDDEVHRILARLGVAEQFTSVSRPAAGLRLLDARHRVLGEFDRSGISPASGFPRANMFDQPDLERLLRDRAVALDPVTLRGGVEVTAVEPAGAGARVTFRDLISGEVAHVEADAVIGADGANSIVRSAIGARTRELGFEQHWLVIDIETSVDLAQWEGVHQVCDSRRAATYMRIGEKRYRWEFQLLDGESADDFADVEALRPLLAPWIGDRLDSRELTLIRRTDYTFRAVVADRWRSGRVFLAGDAAHLTPPFIGQGMGAGLRDAENLGWKLAAVLTGQLDPEHLDSYETERIPHATGLIRLARLTGQMMTSGGRLGDRLRRVAVPTTNLVPAMRRAVTDSATAALSASTLVHRRDPLAGRLCPNAVLDEGLGARLDDVAAGRWSLVSRSPLAPSDRQAVSALGVTIVEVGPDSDLGRWLADAGRVAAVVRPDATVLCSASTVSPTAAVLTGLLSPEMIVTHPDQDG